VECADWLIDYFWNVLCYVAGNIMSMRRSTRSLTGRYGSVGKRKRKMPGSHLSLPSLKNAGSTVHLR